MRRSGRKKMLTDITIGQYYPSESFIHKLDPRTKIFAIFLYIIGLFTVSSIKGYLVYTLFAAFVVILARIPFKILLRSLKPLLLIILITMVMNFFLTPGKPLWKWFIFSVTGEGLRLGILMAARLILLISFTSLLTLTTTPINLTDGMEKILKPFKSIGVPAHELAMMMTIALRFIPTLAEELDKIMKAQMARGADFESKSFMKRIKSLVPLLVPLFISAFRRADELALAMEARCYRGGENRTRMYELSLSMQDYIVISLLAVVFVLTLILHFTVKL